MADSPQYVSAIYNITHSARHNQYCVTLVQKCCAIQNIQINPNYLNKCRHKKQLIFGKTAYDYYKKINMIIYNKTQRMYSFNTVG